VGDAEDNEGIEGDATGLPHPGGIEGEQPSQDAEDDRDESVAHEEHTYEERDHGVPPEGDDATAESDADPTRSQDLTAGDHVGEDVLSEQQATLGEGDAEHSVSETEAEAASEHKPDSASGATTEPEAGLDEVKSRHPPIAIGDDLADMVKILQGGPIFSSSTHLVVAGEIPDED
jgi:hypothetical protein